MIDYDKLKLAHELAEKYYKKTSLPILVEHSFAVGCHSIPCTLFIDKIEWQYDTLDSAIFKLCELTGSEKPTQIPKPKYKVGQKVWAVGIHQQPIKFSVDKIHLSSVPPMYKLEGADCGFVESESLIYSSREELIESQIEYWNKLIFPSIAESTFKSTQDGLKLAEQILDRNKRIKEITDRIIKSYCQHESDGLNHNFSHPGEEGNLVMNRCKKCEKFY